MILMPSESSFPFDRDHSAGLGERANVDAYLFPRDISTFVFPSSWRSSAVVGEIQGSVESQEAARAVLAGIGRERDRGDASLIFEAGNAIAAEVCGPDGEVTFEAYLSDEGEIRIARVRRGRVRKVGPYYVAFWSRSWPFLRVRGGPRFATFQIPRALGGGFRHRATIWVISRVGSFAPLYQRRDEKLLGSDGVSDYGRTYVEFLTSATSAWGWQPGSRYFEYSSEYLLLIRSIQVRRARAILRQEILVSLNSYLMRLGISASIRLEGGTSVEECDAVEAKLESGSIPTSEVLTWLSNSVQI